MWQPRVAFATGGGTYNGATTINAGTLILSSGISGAQNLTLTGAGDTTISGAIAISSGSLIKNGSATATLSAANTYSGTLVAAAANALGSTSQIVVTTGGSLLVTADDSVNNSAKVTLAGGSLAFSGNRSETFGALTLSANSTLEWRHREQYGSVLYQLYGG